MGASGNGAATRVLVIWAELKRSGTTVVSKQAIDAMGEPVCAAAAASPARAVDRASSARSTRRTAPAAPSHTCTPSKHISGSSNGAHCPAPVATSTLRQTSQGRIACHGMQKALALLALQLLLGAAVKMTLQ